MSYTQYPHLGESLFRATLPNGLSVIVAPRPGFTRKIAYFVTDYGAIHTHYTIEGSQFQAPAGVAHYLEHKLFDMPGHDITGDFAALGAVPNAFTGYDVTAYHFSCTENFPACLRLLLQFVSTPYFTQESVDKEQGIVGQEIDMNEDSPDSKSFELLMGAMYENHPVRIPILGTRDTISRITPQILSACHRAFYHPENMLLCVVGDVSPEEVVEIASRELPPAQGQSARAIRQWPETMTCRQHEVSATMEVAMPMFQLGFKCEPLATGEEAVRAELIGELAAEALFGESSALYTRLYEAGLIDSSFGGGFETLEGMALLTVAGDSDDPHAVRDAILAEAAALVRDGIAPEALQRMKRSAMGRRIRGLDSFDSVAFRLCAYHFSDFDYFRFPGLYESVTQEDLRAFLQRVVTWERSCLCVIYPKEQEET